MRDQRRIDVVVAGPIERAAIAAQNMALEILEAHRTEPQPPELARGMQQIQMHLGRECRDGSRHAIARLKQRPVKTFSVERHEDGALLHALGKFEQQRMLFIEIAHEELLDLQAARVPPRDAHHERIRAGAAREAGRFRVEKQPLFRIEREPFRNLRASADWGRSKESERASGAHISGVAYHCCRDKCSP